MKESTPLTPEKLSVDFGKMNANRELYPVDELMVAFSEHFPNSRTPSRAEITHLVDYAAGDPSVIYDLIDYTSSQPKSNEIYQVYSILENRLLKAEGDFSAIKLEGERARNKRESNTSMAAEKVMRDSKKKLKTTLPNRRASPLERMEQEASLSESATQSD